MRADRHYHMRKMSLSPYRSRTYGRKKEEELYYKEGKKDRKQTEEGDSISKERKGDARGGGTASRRLSSGGGLFFHSLRGWEKGADEVAVSIHIINTSCRRPELGSSEPGGGESCVFAGVWFCPCISHEQ